MLNHRTNLLLNKEDYNLLSQLAEKTNRSIGSLIRHAIRVTYQDQKQHASDTSTLIRNIQQLTESLSVSSQDKAQWLHQGRKYETES